MSIRFDGLGINLSYVPKSIQLFGYTLPILGILLTVSMLLGILFVVLESKRRGQDQNLMLGAILMAVPGAVLGGRLFYVGFSWNLFKSDLMSVLSIRNGGMAYYGALIGGMLFVSFYCSLRRASFGEVADNLTFAVLIVQIFTRFGDFFNRESFGTYTEWANAMQLPLASVRSGEVTAPIRENLLTIDGAPWVQVHPTFLYDMLWCLLIFLFLLLIRKRKKFDGEIYMRYLAAYGFGRVFIEWLRTDQLWIPTTTLSVNMILAGAFFVIYSLALSVSKSMAKKRTEAANKRKKELEEVKAAEEAAAAKAAEEPVDIEAILREEERLQEQERLEEERLKAEQQALEDAERVLAEKASELAAEEAAEKAEQELQPLETAPEEAEAPGTDADTEEILNEILADEDPVE